jgi:hypothetical protein
MFMLTRCCSVRGVASAPQRTRASALNSYLVRWVALATTLADSCFVCQSLLNCSAHNDGLSALVGDLETESFEEAQSGTIRPDPQ